MHTQCTVDNGPFLFEGGVMYVDLVLSLTLGGECDIATLLM